MVFVCRMETKMGTYTTNYNLFMPTVGETGWGTLVNGNFETIDTELKSLNNKLVSTVAAINYTVTPDTTTYFYKGHYASSSWDLPAISMTVLPRIYGVTYTGSIQIVTGNTNNSNRWVWNTNYNGDNGSGGSTRTCSFENATHFVCGFASNSSSEAGRSWHVAVYGFTLEPTVTT